MKTRSKWYWAPAEFTRCVACWKACMKLDRKKPDGNRWQKFAKSRESCEDCANTQMDAIPWAELFMVGREWGGSLTVSK